MFDVNEEAIKLKGLNKGTINIYYVLSATIVAQVLLVFT